MKIYAVCTRMDTGRGMFYPRRYYFLRDIAERDAKMEGEDEEHSARAVVREITVVGPKMEEA